MKVILSAFGGKLTSEVQEWPEGTRSRIYLPLDLESLKFNFNISSRPEMPRRKTMGTFENSSLHKVLPGGETAAIYILVDVAKGLS